ncbi:hypothetical protein RCC89_04070 [Cytophagaceae bacterium ABcell3]|nr:hypothetical protein RCC89_04070 [Cytophagaceae bacterium ABcell3]
MKYLLIIAIALTTALPKAASQDIKDNYRIGNYFDWDYQDKKRGGYGWAKAVPEGSSEKLVN